MYVKDSKCTGIFKAIGSIFYESIIKPYFNLISDDIVLDLLAIADEFVVEKLTARCEGFLLSRSRRSPIELIQIAKKYSLKNLAEFAMVRVIRMPGLLRQMDDADLGLEIENRILRLVIEHYRSSQISCCVHEYGDRACCYEKTRLNSTDFDSDEDSSDDEDSVCYPDCVNYEGSIFRKGEYETSDSDV